MEKRNLHLSASGLLKATQTTHLENDFQFLFQNLYYKCSRFLACFISPKVCDLIKLDPTTNTFKIKIDWDHYSTEEDTFDDENQSNLIQDVFTKLTYLMKGKEIEINKKEEDILIKMALELGNGELLSMLKKEGDTMKVENVIEKLNVLSQSHITTEEEIAFIASHFTEFTEKQIKEMCVDTLESVMSHPKFVIKNENWLYDLIISLGKKYDVLLSYVEFEYLCDEKMNDFLEKIEFDDLNIKIWRNLCRRLKLHVDSHLHYTRHIGVHIPYENEPFKGIFNKLNEECNGNAISKEIVLTKASDGGSCHSQFINYSSDNCHSISGENNWLLFDFQKRAVILQSYTLQSPSSNSYFLISWSIEGSNDKTNWALIDKQITRDICANNLFKTFTCNSEQSYQYIRLRREAPDSEGSNYITFKNIEFFGYLVNAEDK
ncbi:hypothetical protein TRFO_08393 [Tritrichomonas foetus]|uniref:F5/8 type C domain-containing protein n=1 Tax=Tritrichomonas foetus TaxID=1144522 RepID=A0A1J4JM05_9EUKA|nr:hypothetical protein TRFO_08393 [Tritrichomonas foetus]|eukprot:OHS99455.1 hypothetical protein TRFO_08393 [Tritrichomonas foetus]